MATDLEQAAAFRVYAADLLRHADAYKLASTAVGLSRPASRYLYSEGERLARESESISHRADELFERTHPR